MRVRHLTLLLGAGELAIEKSRTAEMRAQVAEKAMENEILREDFEATFGEDFK